MIEIRIKEIAKERGIQNAHRLQLAAELSPAVASRFWKSKIEKISMETLGRLCKALECQPGDLLVFVPAETRPASKEREGVARQKTGTASRPGRNGKMGKESPKTIKRTRVR